MKRYYLFLLVYLMLLGNADAAFVSGSTEADGAFNPTVNTELQLPADGIFNFTTVNIPSGVTVTFKKNAANTPAYILATGNVTIVGAIYVNGGACSSQNPGSGGPGGYDGGYGGGASVAGGKGVGPGSGAGGINSTQCSGGGGGFANAGGTRNGAGGPAYGNVTLSPVIGGSGGGGSAGLSTTSGYGGGGGGGAIIIASSGIITISGSITANGGNCGNTLIYPNCTSDPAINAPTGGGGSGGGIRLVANSITGTGTIQARGGNLAYLNSGGKGRIRLEAYINSFTSGTDPQYSYGQPSSVFISNIPSLSITSIAGTNVPASPTGTYAQPDIMLPSTTTNPVAVNVSAANIPVGTSVKVRVIPQYGSENTATSTLSGTNESSTATVNVNLSTTYSNVVTAESAFTIVGMYYDGEEIDRVRVAATMGGRSETTYITKSGKEIKGEMLAALMK